MQKDEIGQLLKRFDDYRYEKEGVEFWFARDIQDLLGYSEWRNFRNVIEHAMDACLNSEQTLEDHFVGANKMIDLGKGGKRSIEDIMLTRYACYLIAQNGDPSKPSIAFAQSYLPSKPENRN